ncbi:MAG: GNAT family N-acetyltransferase [Woeseia sp.]
MASNPSLNTRLCADRESLQQLRDDWQSLANVTRSPLLDHAWFDACANHLHANDALHVLVQYDNDDSITAIAPLVRVERERRTWLEFLGSEQLYEPAGMLYRDPATLPALYESIAKARWPVQLRRLPADPEHAALAPQRRLQSGLWMRATTAATAVLDLQDGWDAFYATLSSQRRYDHRRAQKRAKAIGAVRFQPYAPTADETPDLLDQAFAIENRSWKGQQGSSILKRPQLESFFRSYSLAAAAEGSLRVFFLVVDEVAVSMALCVEKYDALWFLKIGYDETYAKCSPGILQLMYIIEHCCANRTSRIEHLGSFEPWLAAWTSSAQAHATFVHYPLNLTGAGLLLDDIVRVVGGRLTPQRKEA